MVYDSGQWPNLQLSATSTNGRSQAVATDSAMTFSALANPGELNAADGLNAMSFTLSAHTEVTFSVRLDYQMTERHVSVTTQQAGAIPAVPEPGTWGLMAGGLVALAGASRRRKKA